jgi:hypothetical protein
MIKISNSAPPYNAEKRSFIFARDVRMFVKTLPKNTGIFEDGKQLIKASGSVQQINEKPMSH